MMGASSAGTEPDCYVCGIPGVIAVVDPLGAVCGYACEDHAEPMTEALSETLGWRRAELTAQLREDLGPHRLWLIDKIERLNGLLLRILRRG